MCSARSSRRMIHSPNEAPYGVVAIQQIARQCCPRARRRDYIYKAGMLALTFIVYCCYHMSRKPISVVKSVLHLNCTSNESGEACGYAPFDRSDASTLFGMLDSAFLFSYAIAMFISGFIAERVSLRYFLAFGMMLSGLFAYLFGLARTANIHNLWYFLIVQACAGIVQTSGWPGVVTVVGRWFGKSKRGLIFGIWNSHTSIGNILGTLIAARFVEINWAYSFMVPGIIIAIGGFLTFLFLIDDPESVGCAHVGPHESSSQSSLENGDNDYLEDQENATIYDADVITHRNSNDHSLANESTPILGQRSSSVSTQRPISLWDALYIPGVVEFSLCLFFSKLVNYTFLYWLPMYIQASSTLSPTRSADLSTLFDVGGIIGAITAGFVSDWTGMSAFTCAIMLFFASPTLLLYQQFGATSFTVSVVLLLIAGLLVNGPYALITTSVSAELGQHNCIEGNANALATVTAIIDGTGSIGAAVGPLLAGLISANGWQNVFYMLIISNLLAMLLLVRLVRKEFDKRRRPTRIRVE